MLAACGTDMPGALAKPLGGGVWELRVRIRDGAVAARVTYWFAPGRVVFLTVFRKTRQHEEDEVQRARGARKVCERDHGTAADTYRRTV
ncbi:type II toxin-antitoxin system RelE/ParE family toxin [Streptomyces sp. SKN60]|nr:type II toxin-antitoxin system RelE/ParE family toxin [Streptomyces sp. SKN60]